MTTPTDPVGERDLLAELSAKWRERKTARVLHEAARAAFGICADELEDHTLDHTLVRTAELEALVKAAREAATYDGEESDEPCWRCGGGGSYCEEQTYSLEECRCCLGHGDHPQGNSSAANSSPANPKRRECEMEPELVRALAPFERKEGE